MSNPEKKTEKCTKYDINFCDKYRINEKSMENIAIYMQKMYINCNRFA